MLTNNRISRAMDSLRVKVMDVTVVLANAKSEINQTEIQCEQLLANETVHQVARYPGWFFDCSCWNLTQCAAN